MKTIAELHKKAESNKHSKIVSLAAAHDEQALEAVCTAKQKNIAEAVLVGYKKEIEAIAQRKNFDLSGFEIIDCKSEKECVQKAVQKVSSGEADILMKGKVSTSGLLRGVLNDEWGLKTGRLLSHFTIFELNNYHKLLGVTDVAMNIAPDLKEKIGILNNSVQYMNQIGIKNPKVAVVAAVEKVNPKMPATIDAAVMAKMSDRKQITGCTVDGPFALDNALSKESAENKGIVSDVAGDADLILVPNIETGNVFYKALAFTDAKLAAVILGASAPIVLTSRSDSKESKLNSLVLAAVS
ncbi:MAG: bifunctional enoyl-CoA hydratase/phosphate acetyltransferase [Bacteroidota bacterium]|nr:bifunctional enoyl-CoA hydratase/phosphate acetyltransferase [Bacteroidota bacterium]